MQDEIYLLLPQLIKLIQLSNKPKRDIQMSEERMINIVGKSLDVISKIDSEILDDYLYLLV
jgi:hypothetical protein